MSDAPERPLFVVGVTSCPGYRPGDGRFVAGTLHRLLRRRRGYCDVMLHLAIGSQVGEAVHAWASGVGLHPAYSSAGLPYLRPAENALRGVCGLLPAADAVVVFCADPDGEFARVCRWLGRRCRVDLRVVGPPPGG